MEYFYALPRTTWHIYSARSPIASMRCEYVQIKMNTHMIEVDNHSLLTATKLPNSANFKYYSFEHAACQQYQQIEYNIVTGDWSERLKTRHKSANADITRTFQLKIISELHLINIHRKPNRQLIIKAGEVQPGRPIECKDPVIAKNSAPACMRGLC